jgi:hypothetical protein
MERERREEKGREGMDAPGAGPPKIFGLEPPLLLTPPMQNCQYPQRDSNVGIIMFPFSFIILHLNVLFLRSVQSRTLSMYVKTRTLE